VFAGLHRLAALRQAVRPLWNIFDTLVVPTAPTIYQVEEVLADPRRLNARLGRYVNFVNLLDLAGVAVPGEFRPDGLPSGVTFLGPWGSEGLLGALAADFHVPASDRFSLAVVGAHLSGEPLNHQLTDLGGRLLRTCRTAPLYRLYALAGTKPAKPGLVRLGSKHVPGAAVEVEVWDLPRAKLGAFFRGVVPPLAIGTLQLEDGSQVAGFLCEAYAVAGAEDISSFGGWRRYRSTRGP
jgi:allophanate hydrolase